jgi:hypothetical protein
MGNPWILLLLPFSPAVRRETVRDDLLRMAAAIKVSSRFHFLHRFLHGESMDDPLPALQSCHEKGDRPRGSAPAAIKVRPRFNFLHRFLHGESIDDPLPAHQSCHEPEIG